MSEESRENKWYALKSSATRAARQDGHKDEEFEVYPKDEGWAYRAIHGKPNQKMKDQFNKTHEKHKKDDEKAKAKPSPVGKQQKLEDDALDALEERAKERGDTPALNLINAIREKKEQELIDGAAELDVAGGGAVTVQPVKQLTLEEQLQKDFEEAAKRRAEEAKLNPPPEPEPPAIPTLAKPKPEKKVREVKDDDKIHKSTVESPTKLVWHIAEEMKKANPAVTRKQVLEECERRGVAYYTARTQYQQWLTIQRESKASSVKVNGPKK